MKLSELLKQISTLPIKRPHRIFAITDQERADDIYQTHAANVLPELVEAAKNAMVTPKGTNAVDNIKALYAAIANAEEVKVD